MSFSFGPPANVPNQAAGQALSNAMAPAPVDLSSAIAANLQGAHDAAERHPELPPGQYDLEIVEFRANAGHFGLAFFVDCKVLQASNNTPPGGIYSVKINGFNNPNSKPAALRDLKSFTRAASARVVLMPGAPPGIPEAWNGSDPEWSGLVNNLVTSGCLKGQRVFAQTQVVTGKTSGKSKTVASWMKAQ